MNKMESKMYTQDFFDALQEGAILSAKEIIPLVLKLIQPQSVVDVGCGTGTWLSVFKEFGIKYCLGIDGTYVDKEQLLILKEEFLAFDLKQPIEIDRTFDLVVSLEVAEHLPGDCAETFVKSLTRLGEIILFSAAVPFQGGTGHLNEQWPHYWAQYFYNQGYLVVDCFRKNIWNNNKVEFWYAQNILLFVKQDCLHKYPLIEQEIKKNTTLQIDIIHPRLYLTNINNLLAKVANPISVRSGSKIDKEFTQIKVENLKTRIVKPHTNNLNVTTSISKKPRIDIVLQATGRHGWSFSHGWVNILQREGLLNRVFTPLAAWGAEEPVDDDGLYEYLKNPQADIILMPGLDWHSQPLHKTIKWQERWHQAQITKIALLQECYSAEVVQKTPAWQQQMHQALVSTVSCVDALICHHEPDVDFLKNQLRISLPTIFLPFYVDVEYFRNQKPFTDRLNRALFRGNAARHFTENTYKERHKLIEALSKDPRVDLFSNNLYVKKYPVEVMQEYVYELNEYQICLNLPSLAPTFTVRPFEIMACGSLLLQNRIIGEQSKALFQDWEHLVYYDANKPEDLIEKVEYLLADPGLSNKIAKKGQILCHQLHTNECRINTILEWINNGFKTTPFLNYSQFTNGVEESKIKNSVIKRDSELTQAISSASFKVIVDGVFFQLYQTGIARVWKSLLEEWANSGFATHIVVLDRAGTAPKIAGIRYRSIPLYDYNNTDADQEMLQQVCDEEGTDLFISSYYTTPTTTPSVFMAYDMIPEVMGWDMDNPMWREKHQGIQHASAYIAISEHTAHDLARCFTDISKESITVAHCGAKSTFYPYKSEDINAFKYKYGITKPYFILVGGGSGYKNSILFFQAFLQLASSYGFDIVCTGSGGVLVPEFRAYTLGSIVHMLQLSDEELATAYSGAVALVYPSKYEGFGMPIIEAMACGCPVITCPNSSIPEVAGDAAIYIQDDDVNALANALCEVQKPSTRHSLITAGLAQAKNFSWTKMAQTVSSALIDATLLSLNINEINLIIFPDWSQPEDLVGLELQRVMKTVATHMDRKKTTLLINTGNLAVEDAELFLSSVVMNLLVQEDLDVTERLEISLVENLADIQWEALLPRIHARIVLEYEDKNALSQAKAETLTSYEVEIFIEAQAEQFFFA